MCSESMVQKFIPATKCRPGAQWRSTRSHHIRVSVLGAIVGRPQGCQPHLSSQHSPEIISNLPYQRVTILQVLVSDNFFARTSFRAVTKSKPKRIFNVNFNDFIDRVMLVDRRPLNAPPWSIPGTRSAQYSPDYLPRRLFWSGC
jgi:hypothetical protein